MHILLFHVTVKKLRDKCLEKINEIDKGRLQKMYAKMIVWRMQAYLHRFKPTNGERLV
jgi:hypothetical protein